VCKGGGAVEDGTTEEHLATLGADGAAGKACPAPPGAEHFAGLFPSQPKHGVAGTVYDGIRNTSVTALSGLKLEFFDKYKGKSFLIAKQTVDVDAAVGDEAGYKYVSVTFTPAAAGTGHVLEIRVNGKVVASVTFDVL
jgi:hypothetical protein